MTPEDKARLAKEFIEDPRFTEGEEALRRELYKEWVKTPYDNTEKLLELKKTEVLLDKFIKHFKSCIDKGKLSESLKSKGPKWKI